MEQDIVIVIIKKKRKTNFTRDGIQCGRSSFILREIQI